MSSKRSAQEAGILARREKKKRSREAEEPSLLASLHFNLLKLVLSFYCRCKGTSCKDKGFPCRSHLRLVNRHWRNTLQGDVGLLNPDIFVNPRALWAGIDITDGSVKLTDVGVLSSAPFAKFEVLFIDNLFNTIRKSGWLCERVRTVMEPPHMINFLEILRMLPNLCELFVWSGSVDLTAIASVAPTTLTKLAICATPPEDVKFDEEEEEEEDEKSSEKKPFPTFAKLQSLELDIADKLEFWKFDLSNLALALPCLTRLEFDCDNDLELGSIEHPLSLRYLRCHATDLQTIHLTGNFVETLHLTGWTSVPVPTRCDVMEVEWTTTLCKFGDVMPNAEPKELRFTKGFRGALQPIVKTGIPLITIFREEDMATPTEGYTFPQRIEQDVTVRMFWPCGAVHTFVRDPLNHFHLKPVR